MIVSHFFNELLSDFITFNGKGIVGVLFINFIDIRNPLL